MEEKKPELFEEKEHQDSQPTTTTEVLPKNARLNTRSLEELECTKMKILLDEILIERENLHSLIQKQQMEINHLHKIQSLDIFYKLN